MAAVGGSVFLEGGSTSFQSSDFRHPTALDRGGALYFSGNAKVEIIGNLQHFFFKSLTF
jgi:hypothetical protein